MSRSVTYILASLVALVVVLTPGCQVAGEFLGMNEQPAPATSWPASPISFEPYEDPGPQEQTARFAFLGDNPRYDHVPFENRSVTNITRHTFTVDGLDFDPHVDAAGRELVFASTRNSRHPDIYIKSVEGTALQQLTADPADDIQPEFSPDGRRVAFASNRAGNWDIWVANRDGTNLIQMTHNLGDEIAPSWSPKGDQIVFNLWSPRARRWEVWTLDVDQPGIRRFLTFGMFPTWSPKGDKIAFQRARERGTRWYSIWTVDLENGEARRPTELAHWPNAACIAPTWSPDGSMIAYSAVTMEHPQIDPVVLRRNGQKAPPPQMKAELWVVGVETGNRLRLTDDGSPSFNPTWSNDDRVYFVSARDGEENIWSCATRVREYGDGTPVAANPQANTPVNASRESQQ